MNNTNESRKKKIKDPFLQVSESFFEKEEILDIMSHYGFHGIGIYLKISIMLLKNEGKMKYDWKYISTKKSDKIKIEEIITNSGLFYFNSDGTYFSSFNVDEQLKERGKISMDFATSDSSLACLELLSNTSGALSRNSFFQILIWLG